MKMVFTFKRLDRSEALEEYARHRIAEISQFLLKDGLGQVYFSKVKNVFRAEVKVNSRERYFKAQSENVDAYSAIDLVVSKLERQFLKTRKLHKNHKKFELSKEGKMRHLNSQFEYVGRFRKAA